MSYNVLGASVTELFDAYKKPKCWEAFSKPQHKVTEQFRLGAQQVTILLIHFCLSVCLPDSVYVCVCVWCVCVCVCSGMCGGREKYCSDNIKGTV